MKGMSTRPAGKIVAHPHEETRVRGSFGAARALTRQSGRAMTVVG